ncbi:hypothetical protein [Bacillus glycinifermentans]|uniref:hypothetical protein n=1 Tax=Bacillus glycinifermentans TaxID=1664069 RepID=UPI0015819B08|nr:hypothetical protein [Bacillus glycinifermentans]
MDNQACLGYVILAAKRLGYSQEQINVLVLEVESEFKWKTAEEAADVYKAFPVQYSTAE